jgi:hypothetical protein
MNASDQLRAALNAVTASMDAAIALAKEQGRFEQRDDLIGLRDCWTRAANHICNHAGPRGRHAVPPIVPASYSLKPPVRVAHVAHGASRPPLRLVELESPHQAATRLLREATRTKRDSGKLLRDAQGTPDAS